MSLTKSDRNIRHKMNNLFPSSEFLEQLTTEPFAVAIARLLKFEFQNDQSMVKSIMACTNTKERTVKNWLGGKNAPNAETLVSLMSQSDSVLVGVLFLSGRKDLIRTKSRQDIVRLLLHVVELLDDDHQN